MLKRQKWRPQAIPGMEIDRNGERQSPGQGWRSRVLKRTEELGDRNTAMAAGLAENMAHDGSVLVLEENIMHQCRQSYCFPWQRNEGRCEQLPRCRTVLVLLYVCHDSPSSSSVWRLRSHMILMVSGVDACSRTCLKLSLSICVKRFGRRKCVPIASRTNWVVRVDM